MVLKITSLHIKYISVESHYRLYSVKRKLGKTVINLWKSIDNYAILKRATDDINAKDRGVNDDDELEDRVAVAEK